MNMSKINNKYIQVYALVHGNQVRYRFMKYWHIINLWKCIFHTKGPTQYKLEQYSEVFVTHPKAPV